MTQSKTRPITRGSLLLGLAMSLADVNAADATTRNLSFTGDGATDVMFMNVNDKTLHVARSANGRLEYAGQWSGPGAFGGVRTRYYPGDFNGDGRIDVAYHDPGNWIENGVFHVSLSSGAALAYSTGLSKKDFFSDATYIGDYNGDGKDDVGLYRHDWREFWVALSTGTNFAAPVKWVAKNAFGDTINNYYPGDYNGDGKTDLGFFQTLDNTFHVGLSTGSGFKGAGSGRWIATGHFGGTHGVHYVGDFNGDGKDDLGFHDSPRKTFHVTLSTGTGFSAETAWVQPNQFGSTANMFFPGDYNADGKDDLGYFEPNTGAIWVAISHGSGFGGGTVWSGAGQFGDASGLHYQSRAGRRGFQGVNWLPPAPDVPSNLTFSDIGYYGVRVNWNDNSYNEQEFEITFTSRQGRTSRMAPANARSLFIDGSQGLFEPGGRYCFTVIAWNVAGGHLSGSGERCVTMLAVAPMPPPPPPPPSTGNLNVSLSLDVGSMPTNCGEMWFMLDSSKVYQKGLVTSRVVTRDGRSWWQCEFTAGFANVAPGSQRVTAGVKPECATLSPMSCRQPIIQSCGVTNVVAGSTARLTLLPFVCR